MARTAQSTVSPVSPAEDHRVRVAREKRERMRRRLLDATMEVCARTPAAAPIIVDDIMKVADISRGTFYNYFTSVEEIISAVGRDRADEFSDMVVGLRGGILSPIQHVAVAHHLFLSRAALEPVWGTYFLRWNYVVVPPKAGMKSVFALGLKAGDFQFSSVANARDFAMGAVLGAVRRIVLENDASIENICEVQRMVLMGLGVPAQTADETVKYAVDYVREHGSKISWWRDLSTKRAKRRSAPKKAPRA